MKLVKKVLNKLREYDFHITKHYSVDKDNNKYYIHLKECVLYIDENKKNVDISFNMLNLPDLTARITLIINSISNIETISIMESHFFNQEGKLLSGNEALTEFKKELLVCEQKKNELFEGVKCFNC